MCGALPAEENAKAKALLDRIVAMLTKLGRRGYAVHEDPGEYRLSRNDSDTDTDLDTDGSTERGDRQPGAEADAARSRR